MIDLLIHTSDKKFDILYPQKIPNDNDAPCICFSLNQFISYFGDFIYLFDKKVLMENFYVKEINSEGVGIAQMPMDPNRTYRFIGQSLGKEFRIYEPIDVQKYGMGIVTSFNYMKGVLEERFLDEVTRREIDFSKK